MTFRVSNNYYRHIQQYPTENDEEKSSLHVKRLRNNVIVISTGSLFEKCTSWNSSSTVSCCEYLPKAGRFVNFIVLILSSFGNAWYVK